MKTVAQILAERGYSLVGGTREADFPKASGLMRAEAKDAAGRRVFVKIGSRPWLGRSILAQSHRVLEWLGRALPRGGLLGFPRALDYFSSGGRCFLVQEFVDHDRDGWAGTDERARFQRFVAVIARLQEIGPLPAFLERYDQRSVSRILARQAKYVAAHTTTLDPAALGRVVESFRLGRALNERHWGCFSHNDIHVDNLLCSAGEGRPKYTLVDVEACRVSHRFADVARCYNRVVLRTARERFRQTGEIRHEAFPELYESGLRSLETGDSCRQAFDLMLQVDNLMYLYFVLRNQRDPELRRFNELFCGGALKGAGLPS